MVTAFDAHDAVSVSVFTDGSGRYAFPALHAATYRVRARRIGFEETFRDEVAIAGGAGEVAFALRPAADFHSQLPASYFYSRLEWPDARVKENFTRGCANCHQIGDHRWRRARSAEEWQAILARMVPQSNPLSDRTRAALLPALLRVFGPQAARPDFALPAPPRGDAVRVAIYEYEIDPVGRRGCHDLEVGPDGVVYTADGFTLDPETFERGHHPVPPGAHSIEQDRAGNMWITITGTDQLARIDARTKRIDVYDQPDGQEQRGIYPHTLSFDDRGRIWFTLTGSNHVARFDPDSRSWSYYRLPEESDIGGPWNEQWPWGPTPIPYGLEVAPDQGVWWTQLLGPKIGRIDPGTGKLESWKPPFEGPRRLSVGPDGIVWVPGYGSSVLGRFDPRTHDWKVYPLPSAPAGSDLPYAVAVNRKTGSVWITGSNSGSLIRLEPASERWTVFELPTAASFMREIEFAGNGDVWSCTGNQETAPGHPGAGRFVRLHFL
jgi:streptogramin lyase